MLERQKFIRPEVKILDAAQGRIHAIVSTEAKDRDGDIIRAAGWDLTHFLSHPVLLNAHKYTDITDQIGVWEGMAVKGRTLQGDAVFNVGVGNPKADYAFTLAQRGQLAFSVGFIPDMAAAKELTNDGWLPTYEFNAQELLEVSAVPVPSNRDALQALKAFGGLHPVVESVIDDVLAGDVERRELDLEFAVCALTERVHILEKLMWTAVDSGHIDLDAMIRDAIGQRR